MDEKLTKAQNGKYSKDIEKNVRAINKLKAELKVLELKIEKSQKNLEHAKGLIDKYKLMTGKIINLNKKINSTDDVSKEVKDKFKNMIKEAESIELKLAESGLSSEEDYQKQVKSIQDKRQLYKKYKEMIENIERQNKQYVDLASKTFQSEYVDSGEKKDLDDDLLEADNNDEDLDKYLDENKDYFSYKEDGEIDDKQNEASEKGNHVKANQNISNEKNKNKNANANANANTNTNKNKHSNKEPKKQISEKSDVKVKKNNNIRNLLKESLLELNNKYSIVLSSFQDLLLEIRRTQDEVRRLLTLQKISKDAKNNLKQVEVSIDEYELTIKDINKLCANELTEDGYLKRPSRKEHYFEEIFRLYNKKRENYEVIFKNNISNREDFYLKERDNKEEIQNIEGELNALDDKLRMLLEVQEQCKNIGSDKG